MRDDWTRNVLPHLRELFHVFVFFGRLCLSGGRSCRAFPPAAARTRKMARCRLHGVHNIFCLWPTQVVDPGRYNGAEEGQSALFLWPARAVLLLVHAGVGAGAGAFQGGGLPLVSGGYCVGTRAGG